MKKILILNINITIKYTKFSQTLANNNDIEDTDIEDSHQKVIFQSRKSWE